MTELAELGAALLPGARWIDPGVAGAGGPISWVRVMKARVPAFDALEPGDLAIVGASALAIVAPGAQEVRAVAEACARARVAGVLLVEGDAAATNGATDPLDVLEAELASVALPALRVPRADVAALERSVIGFLVTRGAELDRQAALLESRLETIALGGGGAPELVGAMASFLGRAVALEGRRGEPVAVHAPADGIGAADAATAVARYHARPRRAVALRLPLPEAGGAAGSLALLGEGPVSELERVAVARVAGLLALELAREEAIRKASDQARRADALPAAGPPWAMLLARQRIPGLDDDTDEARARRDAIRRELRLLAPARRMALRGDADSLEVRAVLALEADIADLEGMAVGSRIAEFLDRTVALSRPFTTASDRPAAEAEARATLDAALELPEPPRVARASRLPMYRLLGALHNLPDGERYARALLEPLLAGRPDVQREHLATLRALLDHGGVNEAAAALGVHRNTVAYRARRIEALTGWRLADPELRLPLSLALRLVQEGQPRAS